MKTIPLGKFKTRLDRLTPDPIKTPPDEINLHAIVVAAAKMKSGKTVSICSKLRDLKQQGFADIVLLLSPTATSMQNARLFEGLADEVYEEPTYATINEIIEKLRSYRASWEEYKERLKAWHEFQRMKKRKNFDESDIAPERLMLAYEQQLWSDTPPPWDYKDKSGNPRPPICHLFVDDAQASMVFRGSTLNPFLQLVVKHRHIGVGCSIWISIQNFGGYGALPKQIRNVTTQFMIWKPADSDKRLQMAKELSAEVSQVDFLNALDFACQTPFDFLLVDLNAKTRGHLFRKNFDTLLQL
jgi:hypothetical protein